MVIFNLSNHGNNNTPDFCIRTGTENKETVRVKGTAMKEQYVRVKRSKRMHAPHLLGSENAEKLDPNSSSLPYLSQNLLQWNLS